MTDETVNQSEMEVVWRIGGIHQNEPVDAVQDAIELFEATPTGFQFEVTRRKDGFSWIVEMADGTTKPQKEEECPMNKILKFMYQYDPNWALEAFKDDPHMGNHFQTRFNAFWKELTQKEGTYGASYAVLKTLFSMSLDNSRKVWNYINHKY